MTITITAKQIELTPAIRQYAEEKMGALIKYLDSIRHIDVEIGRETNRHQKGEVYVCKANVQIGSKVMRVEREEEDLYKAIDKVRDHLRVELTDWKKLMEDRSTGKGESESEGV